MSKINQLKQKLLAQRRKLLLSEECAVSTGSTLLNLACTDNPSLGFLQGGYYYLVGDSASGKTWLSLTCFAEAVRSRFFSSYRLIFDDVEGGALMDIAHYFGKDVLRRVEPPARTKAGDPIYSDTIESFYFHITDLLQDGRPFIYVLDSQDALTSGSAEQKFREQKKALRKGEEVTGSYGDGKAKYHSEHIRTVISGLRKTNSVLIIIGQTRDNIGMMGFAPKTRAGGRALRFYANLEIWTSVMGKIKKRVRGKERTIGTRCLVEVKKNRVTGKTGKDRSVEIPIYIGYGIDDVGSCVDFLVEEKHWKPVSVGDSKAYRAPELEFQGTREELIAYVESESLENRLREVAATVWRELDEECVPKRKRRYD